jgi:hypothetical protein
MQKNITSLSALNWDDLKFFLEVARTRKASSAAKRLGGGLHHRVATDQLAGSLTGHAAVRKVAQQRLRPDRRRPAVAGLGGVHRKHPAHCLRTGFRLRRGTVGACAHGLHRRLWQLLHHPAIEPLHRHLPGHLGGHPAAAALHQPVQARGRYRHRPGTPGTRTLRLLQTLRLQPAALRDPGISGPATRRSTKSKTSPHILSSATSTTWPSVPNCSTSATCCPAPTPTCAAPASLPNTSRPCKAEPGDPAVLFWRHRIHDCCRYWRPRWISQGSSGCTAARTCASSSGLPCCGITSAQTTEQNQAFLLGQTKEMSFVD